MSYVVAAACGVVAMNAGLLLLCWMLWLDDRARRRRWRDLALREGREPFRIPWARGFYGWDWSCPANGSRRALGVAFWPRRNWINGEVGWHVTLSVQWGWNVEIVRWVHAEESGWVDACAWTGGEAWRSETMFAYAIISRRPYLRPRLCLLP